MGGPDSKIPAETARENRQYDPESHEQVGLRKAHSWVKITFFQDSKEFMRIFVVEGCTFGGPTR